MPVHLRAYILIVLLSSISFWIMAKLKPFPIDDSQYKTWAGYWIALTSFAFLAHNYWLFVLVATMFYIITLPKNIEAKLAAYFLLLPALPFLGKSIPGMAGLRILFIMSHPRLLAITVLLPLFFLVLRNKKLSRYYPSDKYFWGLVILWMLLEFRDTTVTNALRESWLIFIDMVLPYYVISRGLQSLDGFKLVFSAILTSAAVISSLGLFESLWNWVFYRTINRPLGTSPPTFFSGRRFGRIRATGPFEHAIVLGYFLTIGFSALVFLRTHFKAKAHFYLLTAIMGLAILATFSRGPIAGLILMISVIALLSPNRGKNLSRIILLSVLGGITLLFFPLGQDVLSFLPGMGDGSKLDTVSYRQRLIPAAMAVIERNLWFGSKFYLIEPELRAMRQGQGIIDLVNSYLEIGLESGIVGLTLFAGFYGCILIHIFTSIKHAKSIGPEYIILGHVLFAATVAVLFIIGTVSIIDYIPYYYWAIAGLGAAYINMISSIMRKRTEEMRKSLAQKYGQQDLSAITS